MTKVIFVGIKVSMGKKKLKKNGRDLIYVMQPSTSSVKKQQQKNGFRRCDYIPVATAIVDQ